jgi:hypothetical protein
MAEERENVPLGIICFSFSLSCDHLCGFYAQFRPAVIRRPLQRSLHNFRVERLESGERQEAELLAAAKFHHRII